MTICPITLGTPIHWISLDGACQDATIHAYRIGPNLDADGSIRPSVPIGDGAFVPAEWSSRDEKVRTPGTWHTRCH